LYLADLLFLTVKSAVFINPNLDAKNSFLSIQYLLGAFMNTFNNSRTGRIMFAIGAVMIVLSLTFSTFSVAKVLSAPQTTLVTVPPYVGFEGFLADGSGDPVADGTYSLTFDVFAGISGGSSLWTETHSAVSVTNGLYSVVLGSVTSLPSGLFDGVRYIQVTEGSTVLSPRIRVSSVPFSLNAEHANSAEGAPWSGITGKPNPITFLAAPTSCSSGQPPVWNGSSWVCQTGVTFAGSGDLSLGGSIEQSITLGARVYHSANQNITNSTWTALNFDSERWDTDNIHNNTTNNTRLTATTAGKYIIIGNASFYNGNVNGEGRLRLNGTTIIANYNSARFINITTIYDLAVNDYVEFIVFQNTGSTQPVSSTANYTPEFMMVRLP
jgi:hypothetical protein